MGIMKDKILDQENRRYRKLNGYRKKLLKDDTYNMDCPYCSNALSDYDVSKEQCLHCGHPFYW